jgi:flagellum-specific peptidoglycan hydrolase FlgJ
MKSTDFFYILLTILTLGVLYITFNSFSKTQLKGNDIIIKESDFKTLDTFDNNANEKTLAYIKIEAERLKTTIFKGKKIRSKEKQFIEGLIRVSLEEEVKFGIPAPIKIAQAILESGWGTDGLAKENNNYFGIKHKRYYNPEEKKLVGTPIMKVTHEYDSKRRYYKTKAKFITYETRWCSIRHHSLFLKHQMTHSSRKGYRNLEGLSSKDYKSWARNLQLSGYSTSHHYERTLLKLIHDYNLHKITLSDNLASLN